MLTEVQARHLPYAQGSTSAFITMQGQHSQEAHHPRLPVGVPKGKVSS